MEVVVVVVVVVEVLALVVVVVVFSSVCTTFGFKASFSSAHHEGPMSALVTAALLRVIVPVHSFAWRPGAALLREQPVPSG